MQTVEIQIPYDELVTVLAAVLDAQTVAQALQRRAARTGANNEIVNHLADKLEHARLILTLTLSDLQQPPTEVELRRR